MQIVIDIDEEVYKNIMNDHGVSPYGMVFNSIQNGTVLPKHGRLIDADALIDTCEFYETDMEAQLAPTILEAWGNEE